MLKAFEETVEAIANTIMVGIVLAMAVGSILVVAIPVLWVLRLLGF